MAFGQAQKMNGIQQVGFPNTIQPNNAIETWQKVKLPGSIAFEMG